MAEWLVDMAGTAEYYVTIRVEADSQEEAESKALAWDGEVEDESYDGGECHSVEEVHLQVEEDEEDDEDDEDVA